MVENRRRTTRRTLLKGLAAGGAAAACPLVVPASALGLGGATAPSERLTMGAIGVGNRGAADLAAFMGFREVQVLAVCDVNHRYLERAKAQVDNRYGNRDCAARRDFRDVTRRADIDFVQIATPDHWHAIPAIDACHNGKDVFCEKPLSLTIREGRAMVEAARRHGRVFSGGSQRVFGDHGRLARYVHDGSLGRILEVWASVGPTSYHWELPAQPVPEWLDWDRWLGPAPWSPFHAKRIDHNRGWEMMRDYAGGQMTNWGAHTFGGALYAVGLDETGPVEVYPPDGKEHPHLTYVFADGLRLYKAKGPAGGGLLCFRGELGLAPHPKQPPPASPKPMRQYSASGLGADFLHCVRTRQRPFRDVEYAHRTATVCHLGNIALWLGRPIRWDPEREAILGDPEADRLLDRPRREPWRL